jgi:hypothetical protein
MAPLDEITQEKQRVSEALTRVDAQRDKLTGQLSELEAAERVLTRYGKGRPRSRGRPSGLGGIGGTHGSRHFALHSAQAL